MLLIAGALCALAAAVGVIGARSATPIEVSLAACYFGGGGQTTVPAGSDVTVRFGWAENNRGRLQDVLNAQTVTADVDGAPIAGASGLWGAIEAGDGFYVSYWRASAGTLASPGDSVSVHFQVALSRAVPEGKDPDTGEHFKAGPGPILPADFGCTITAV